MLQCTPHRGHGNATSWRPTVIMFAAVLAVGAVFAVLWIHYVGPLPVEP